MGKRGACQRALRTKSTTQHRKPRKEPLRGFISFGYSYVSRQGVSNTD